MNRNPKAGERAHDPSSARRQPIARAAAWIALATIAVACGRSAEHEDVKPVTFPETRNMRFCEVIVVHVDGVDVYNTTGVNDCPADIWNTLDVEAIRKQFGAIKVEKNGPHYWMMDSQTVMVGQEADLAGLRARWVARLPTLTALMAAKGSEPYKIFEPKKTQKMIYDKGKPVYELVDPDGHVYVLQAHEEEFPINSLPSLGTKLKLPQGWQYRTSTPSDDLVLDLKSNETIYAIGDDFHQYYTRIPGK
jgi:hypothetical protein